MKIEANSLLGITSILNRQGRRIATHLVDQARDSLEHDRDKGRSETPEREERHKTSSHSHDEDSAPVEGEQVPTLDITV